MIPPKHFSQIVLDPKAPLFVSKTALVIWLLFQSDFLSSSCMYLAIGFFCSKFSAFFSRSFPSCISSHLEQFKALQDSIRITAAQIFILEEDFLLEDFSCCFKALAYQWINCHCFPLEISCKKLFCLFCSWVTLLLPSSPHFFLIWFSIEFGFEIWSQIVTQHVCFVFSFLS